MDLYKFCFKMILAGSFLSLLQPLWPISTANATLSKAQKARLQQELDYLLNSMETLEVSQLPSPSSTASLTDAAAETGLTAVTEDSLSLQSSAIKKNRTKSAESPENESEDSPFSLEPISSLPGPSSLGQEAQETAKGHQDLPPQPTSQTHPQVEAEANPKPELQTQSQQTVVDGEQDKWIWQKR